MRILITGGNGQLGRDLRRVLASHDVTALAHAELDVSDSGAVDAAFSAHRPQVAVHCAAMTDTARCEREPDLSLAVNASGAGFVATAAARMSAMLIALSTNEVFGGAAREPYGEEAATGAVNAYGASKLEGERRAQDADPGVRIVRTSWLYGHGGMNFVEKVLAAAKGGRPLRFVSDEVATPTATSDLAEAIRQMIERDAPPGVYHLTNSGEASRHEWAREIGQLGGMAGIQVEAVTTDELRASGYEGPRKPVYSVLANNHARALGIEMRPWRKALAWYFERARVSVDG